MRKLATRVAELEEQAQELDGKDDERVKAIEKVEKLRRSINQLESEASRQKSEMDRLGTELQENNILLSAANEDREKLQGKMDSEASHVEILTRQKAAYKKKYRDNADEVLREREKVRSLKEDLKGAHATEKAKLEKIASLESGRDAQAEQLKKLADQVAKLGDEVSSLHGLLDKESEHAAEAMELLEARRIEHDKVIQAKTDCQVLLEKERERSRQLEQDREKLTGSLNDLRAWQLDAVRETTELKMKNETLAISSASVKDLERDVTKLTADVSRKEQELSQKFQELSRSRESLESRKGSHNAVLNDTTSRVDSLEKQVTDLTQRLSQTSGLLSRAEEKAQESVEELQSFLVRPCLVSPEDSSAFTGLARQVQVNGDVQSSGPAQVSVW